MDSIENVPDIKDLQFDDPQSLFIKDVQNPTDVDLLLVQRMASIMCTPEEISVILGIPTRVFKEHDLYAAAYERGRASGYTNLRRAQWTQAIKGNPIMQIFLGKQYLGQSDKPQANEADDEAIDAQAFTSFQNKLQKLLTASKPGATPKTIEVEGQQYYKKNGRRKYTYKDRKEMKLETKVKKAVAPVPKDLIDQKKLEHGHGPLHDQLAYDQSQQNSQPLHKDVDSTHDDRTELTPKQRAAAKARAALKRKREANKSAHADDGRDS